MSTKTSIEWTRGDDGSEGMTWNPITNCDRVSDGCDHCYALMLAKRLKAMGSAKYQNDGDPRTSGPGFGVTVHPDALQLPLTWKKPRRIFVNSMSDLFHKDVPASFIAQVFAVMAQAPQHQFQILTKRHARMRSLIGGVMDGGQALIEAAPDEATARVLYDAPWPLPNVLLGVTVENQKWADIRIPALTETAAAVRFLSCEPLLGPISLGIGNPHATHDSEQAFDGHSRVCLDCSTDEREVPWFIREADRAPFDWVICGAESGSGARPISLGWVRSLRDECQDAGVAFFYKQNAVNGKKVPTPELDGRAWTQMPELVTTR